MNMATQNHYGSAKFEGRDIINDEPNTRLKQVF